MTPEELSARIKKQTWFHRRANHVSGLVLLFAGLWVMPIAWDQGLPERLMGMFMGACLGAAGYYMYSRTERNYVVHSRRYAGGSAVIRGRVDTLVRELKGRVLHEEQAFSEYIIPGRWWNNVLLTVVYGDGELHYNLISIRSEERSLPDLFDLGLVPKVRKAFEQGLGKEV